jgi:ATP-binding cassette subfamily B protein
VLDDVLSAVDTETEARLLTELRTPSATGGHTTVIVSHRTSALAHADEILVIEGGRVTERGTHAALCASGGLYARIHARQSERSEST